MVCKIDYVVDALEKKTHGYMLREQDISVPIFETTSQYVFSRGAREEQQQVQRKFKYIPPHRRARRKQEAGRENTITVQPMVNAMDPALWTGRPRGCLGHCREKITRHVVKSSHK